MCKMINGLKEYQINISILIFLAIVKRKQSDDKLTQTPTYWVSENIVWVLGYTYRTAAVKSEGLYAFACKAFQKQQATTTTSGTSKKRLSPR